MNPIKLEVWGHGHVPSFKNNKMLTKGRLITNPERRKWMDWCIRNFESQLVFAMQTIAGETLTEQLAHSLIASCLPEDDCWTRIPQINIYAEKVLPSEEGATITIERIE